MYEILKAGVDNGYIRVKSYVNVANNTTRYHNKDMSYKIRPLNNKCHYTGMAEACICKLITIYLFTSQSRSKK